MHSVPESYNMRHVQGGDTSYDNGYMYSQESDIEMHVSVLRQRNGDRNFALRLCFPLRLSLCMSFFRKKSYFHHRKESRNVKQFIASGKTRSHHGRGTQPNANWSDASYTGGATSGAAPRSTGAYHGAPRY